MHASRPLIDAIDPICDSFEAAWQTYLREEGAQPCADEFLPEGFPGAAELLLKLLEVDLEYCSRSGKSSSLRGHTVWRIMANGACRFQKKAELGKGGMGSVHVAEDLELRRQVALKEISLELKDEPVARLRFLREAIITGRLEHPNIVPVYGLSANAGKTLAYAMRLLPGKTLASEIDDLHHLANGPMRVQRQRELLRCFITVCNAVAFAHSQGIIHRDLKPLNVIVDRFGQTYVIDWGLAKVANEAVQQELDRAMVELTGTLPDETTFGAFVGSRPYASPEQIADSASVGPPADVYSLGATLAHLLSGQSPGAGSPQVSGGNTPGTVRGPRFPRELQAICSRAMAIDPNQRYASPVDLAADIHRYLEDEPVSAYPQPLSTQLRRWLKKHVTGVVATSSAVLVGAVAFMLAGAVIEREQRARDEARHDLVQSELRQTLGREKQKQLVARSEQDWLQAMNRHVAVAQSVFIRKDNPLLSWDNVVRGSAREFLPRMAERAAGPETSLAARYEIAEYQLALAYMTGSMGDSVTAMPIFERTLPALEKLIPELDGLDQKNDHSELEVGVDHALLPTAKNNYAVLLARSGNGAKAAAEFRTLLDWLDGSHSAVSFSWGRRGHRNASTWARAMRYFRIQVEANLAIALRGIGDDEGERRLANAWDTQTLLIRELRGVNGGEALDQAQLIKIALGIQYAELLGERMQFKEAEALVKEVLETCANLLRRNPDRVREVCFFNILNHLRDARVHLGNKALRDFRASTKLASELSEAARLAAPGDRNSREWLLAQFWYLP